MINRLGIGRLLLAAVIGIFACASIDSLAQEIYDLDEAYARWEQASGQSQATASAPPEPAAQTSEPAPPTPVLLRPKAGEVIIDGRLIKTRVLDSPAASSAINETSFGAPSETDFSGLNAARIGVSSATLLAGTPEIQAEPTVTPTPEPVTIKVLQVVDGKIQYVEVQVTPTPGPASIASSTQPIVVPAVISASDTARIISATGMLGDLRDRLSAAISEKNALVKLTAKEVAKLREQIMTQSSRNKAALEGIVAATELTQLQVKIHRLASKPTDVTLDGETARIAFKVLWPEGSQKLEELIAQRAQAAAEIAAAQARAAEAAAQGTETTSADDALFFSGEPETAPQGRQMYIDPVSGRYIYEDGSPVPGYEPVQPQRPVQQQQPYRPPQQPAYQQPAYQQPPPQAYVPQYQYQQQPQGVLGGNYNQVPQYYDENQIQNQPYYVDDGNQNWEDIPEQDFEVPQQFEEGGYQEFEYDEGAFEEQNFDMDEGAIFEEGNFDEY